MRRALIWPLLALALSGCETIGYLRDRNKPVSVPAVIPCDADNCGKEISYAR